MTLSHKCQITSLRAVTLYLVELRGLEPLTPCLQNPHRVSRTVHGLG